MKKLAAAIVVLSIMLFAGCYHAVINTGLNPGSKVIVKGMRPSFIYGLVPPPGANVAASVRPASLASRRSTHSSMDCLPS